MSDSNKDQKNQKKPTREDVSKRVLGNIGRSYSSESTINWLRNMTEDVAPGNRLVGDDELPYMTMISCIDTLFDHFQRYSFEFNREESSSRLHVKTTRPDFRQMSDETVKCQGFLTTSEWSVIIEAEAEKILAYIVKSASLKDFSLRREHYSPFMEMYATSSQLGLVWKVEETIIYFDHLSLIAKKLFARLVRVAKGQASELEPFKMELPEHPPPGGINATLERIRYASSTDNADEVLEQTKERTSDAFTKLQVIVEQDLQELTKMGVMALRSGDSELRNRLSARTKVLTEINEKLRPLASYWFESSK